MFGMGRQPQIPILGQLRQNHHLLGHRRPERHHLRFRGPHGSRAGHCLRAHGQVVDVGWRGQQNSHLGHGRQEERESAVARERRVRHLQEAVLLEF